METPEDVLLQNDGQTSDCADMADLAAGREGALNRLMDRHAHPLFQFLVRMTASEEDANDLAQETFIRVYNSAASFRPAHKFTSWLYTIAANLARNQLRWRARHPTVSIDTPLSDQENTFASVLPSPGKDPRQASESAERIEAVQAAVAQLPEDLREAIVLCEWEEMSVAEAATIMDTTSKAVESKLYRARKLLRERLLPARQNNG